MAEIKDIVKLAVDSYKGRVEKYSVADSQKLLKEALIKANGGSTILDYKKIRDGECPGLFSLVFLFTSFSLQPSYLSDILKYNIHSVCVIDYCINNI